ncbi:hypothetical protein RZ71_09150 [Apilactobacillus kunkeei]|uniref:Uncharacterized protein n=1 Tax=Apilactobacillus kunkeei TaxID=148814 RepID=A0A0M9DDV9_9LACO|nr:hypothetical protein [Apilactobacillus kunkeei]KOY77016.1 hypothetical protein RZ71_09150 [Apilactobacillus kunkeei]
MINITDIACESYKEDLRSYDNPEYVIRYPKYDWRMSYIAYDAMLKTLTKYRNLNQPDTDYETFDKKNNIEVISLVNEFNKKYSIYLISDEQYGGKIFHIKGLARIYYAIIKLNLC